METLVTQPEFEAAQVETEQVGEFVPKNCAQVVKDKSFTAREAELLAARHQAAQAKQHAVSAAWQEREMRDEKRGRGRRMQEDFALQEGAGGGLD